jgi:choline monooxygenase
MHQNQTVIPKDQLQRVLGPIGEARGLPNAAYTSAAHFADERQALIGRTWAACAFTDTIPDKPFAQPLDFLGLPLLITRDRQGELSVFHNVCSHRGMKLVGEPTEVPGLISCRYHCWSYTTRGALKRTPHIGGVDRHSLATFNNADHGLKRVPSAVFMGILFVNLSSEAPSFKEHMAPLFKRAERLLGPSGWSQLRPGFTDSQLALEVRSRITSASSMPRRFPARPRLPIV